MCHHQRMFTETSKDQNLIVVVYLKLICYLSLSKDFTKTEHNFSINGWSLEAGYSSNVSNPFPFKVSGSGVGNTLSLIMQLNKRDFNRTCNEYVQGFKVLLHTPGEVAQISNYFILVPLLDQVFVSVKPNMITTTQALREYTPQQYLFYLC